MDGLCGASSIADCGHNVRMEDAFAIVLFVVVGVAAVAAIWALVTSRSSYDQIGSGGFFMFGPGFTPGRTA